MWLIFILLISNFIFDIYYLVRGILVILYSTIKRVFSPSTLMEDGCLSGICLTTDLDLQLHMNNARYLRECDMARMNFWVLNGIWDLVHKLGGGMVAGAINVRYRRTIDLFTTYKLRTKVLFWDQSAFYLEQTFERQRDGFICCICIVKQTITGVPLNRVIESLGYSISKPEPLPEITKWIESIQSSSERLKKSS